MLLAIVFVIPVGIVKAMTGIEVTMNVLAEFIGYVTSALPNVHKINRPQWLLGCRQRPGNELL